MSGARVHSAKAKSWRQKILYILGPGLVTGSADDDPSGIATYSSVGAQFGYTMLWTMPFIFPFMAAIQEISARLGRVSGHGIAGNMRRSYPRWIVYLIVALLLIANVINIGADIGAMGAAVSLLVGGPTLVYCVVFAVTSVLLEAFTSYENYSAYLKWLTLALFAYVGTVFVVRIDWSEALRGTFLPKISLDREFMAALVAVLGTTISPYLFFWQSAEEVENIPKHSDQTALKRTLGQAREELTRIRIDTYVGMAFSTIIAYFIILTVAVTLHAKGKTDIDSASQAAEALRPVAGQFASLLFSLGIIGTGLLALPVLGGSAAYAVGEALRWPVGLERNANEAKAFYAVLAVATLIGLAINFTKIDPVRALVWAAIINGLSAPPVMCFMMLMASNREVMGKLVLPRTLKIAGWIATGIMFFAAAGMIFTAGK
jgi:NRAMP (natural resistance-associated macrophage protein)-like metal ion transporter